MDEYYAIEKFTRCFRCRSFSLKAETGKAPASLPGSTFICHNCGTRYIFRGQTLEEISQIEPEEKPAVPEKESPGMQRRKPNNTAIFLVVFLGLVIAGMIFLFLSRNRGQKFIASSLTRVETKSPPLEKKGNLLQEKKKEATPVPQAKNTETKTEKREAARQIDRGDDTEVPDEQEQKDNSAGLSYKIFDFSGLKVRKSSPDYADKSRQWSFKRKSLTIKRSEAQRVLIAGDPTGKSKWAVDDEIRINGEHIKGVSGEITEMGGIPDSKRILPYDITYLVPANRKTVLDIRLVDYGIFWGNTSLYIVIL